MGLLSHQVHRNRPKSSAVYVRHRPETTLRYQIIDEYWPGFQAGLASQDQYLPAYITREFDAYLKCGRLEHGFLSIRCETCHDENLVAVCWPLRRILLSWLRSVISDTPKIIKRLSCQQPNFYPNSIMAKDNFKILSTPSVVYWLMGFFEAGKASDIQFYRGPALCLFHFT